MLVFTYRCLLILKMVFKIIYSVLLPKSKYFIKIFFYIVFFTCSLIWFLNSRVLFQVKFQGTKEWPVFQLEGPVTWYWPMRMPKSIKPHSYLLHSYKSRKHIPFAYMCTSKCLHSQIASSSPITKIPVISRHFLDTDLHPQKDKHIPVHVHVKHFMCNVLYTV